MFWVVPSMRGSIGFLTKAVAGYAVVVLPQGRTLSPEGRRHLVKIRKIAGNYRTAQGALVKGR